MKNALKTLWRKFVNYLNTGSTGSAGSRDSTAMGSYAGLCGLDHNEDSHH